MDLSGAPARIHVVLDLHGDAVPVINYKKLKRSLDASAPSAGHGRNGNGGAARDPMMVGKDAPPAPGAAAAARMGGGLAPGDGSGNHMAAVIRRIEGFYSAPRCDDSDDDEGENGEGGDGDANNENNSCGNNQQTDAASSDDEDFVDDGRDPNDPEVIAAKAFRRHQKEEEKRAKALLPGGATKQKQPEEWYDMDDDFIDDDELDSYFERNGRTDKLGGVGADRFYVNRGDLEFVDDGTGTANALKRSRAHASREGHFGGKEWSEGDMKTLIAGVKKHGRRWQTIKRDEEFGEVLRDFSVDSVKHKWKNMIRRGQVKSTDGTGGGELPEETLAEIRDGANGDTPTRGGEPSANVPSDKTTPLGEHRAAAADNAVQALQGNSTPHSRARITSPNDSQKTFGVMNDDGTRKFAETGLGRDGVYCEALTAAILAVGVAASTEVPPEKGSRARLPDAIVEKVIEIVKVCKGPGGEPNSHLPRGILKELMSFLSPFCSPVTLQKRMATIGEQYAAKAGVPE